MKTTSDGAAGWRAFGWFALGLAALLAWMFRQSFAEGWVHFNNDTPLAAVLEHHRNGLSFLPMLWLDLRWLGEAAVGGLSPWLAGILIFDPVSFAKYSPAASLAVTGVAAWWALRILRFPAWPTSLAAMAAVMGSGHFSSACWGVGQKAMMGGYLLLAFAWAASGHRNEGLARCVGRLILAGLFLGMALNEGIDVAALLSPFLPLLILVLEFGARGNSWAWLGRFAWKTAIVVVCAGLVAVHTVSSLFSTQVKEVAGMEQAPESKEQRWDWATQWSLPKMETLGLFVPGFFGFRMDTPDGGAYWGTIGRTPGWEQHRQGMARFSGGSGYLGVLVALGSILAASAAWRARMGNGQSPESAEATGCLFDAHERRIILFWAGAGLAALLLAWGRHAPFYSLFYELPYASTIRNPIKFVHFLAIAAPMLFAYGLLGMHRAGARIAASDKPAPVCDGVLRQWLGGREVALEGSGLQTRPMRWVLFGAGLFAATVFFLGEDLAAHLRNEGFGDAAGAMADHAKRSALWFLVLAASAVGLFVTFAAGCWRKLSLGAFGLALAALLLADLVPANLPWIRHFNYAERYAPNPALELLRESAPQSRVTILARQVPLYGIEWHQHHFLWFGIPCLDPIQMPRVPADYAAFMGALQRNPGRLWQLTSTRFLLGGGNQMLDQLNQLVDPVNKPFADRLRFGGRQRPGGDIEIIEGNGDLVVYEYTRALPRARIHEHWELLPPAEIPPRLAAADFDPAKTVLVDASSNVHPPQVNAGGAAVAAAAEIVRWTPVAIDLCVDVKRPSIVLLADRFHSGWEVAVDGKPAQVLRCNGVMRGVAVPEGRHQIYWRWRADWSLLGINLAALAGLLVFGALGVRSPGSPRGVIEKARLRPHGE